MRPLVRCAGIAMIAVIVVALGTPPALAMPPSRLAMENPSVSATVLAKFPSELQKRGGITISPEITEDTLLFYTDGQPLKTQPGVTRQMGGSCWNAIIVPAFSKDRLFKGHRGIIGMDNTATHTYVFQGNPLSNGTACFTVLGYQDPYPRPIDAKIPVWYNAGRNNTSITVPWGNVAGVAQEKASNNFIIGWAGRFQ